MNKKGFTLIELLVVIAILVILAIFVIPNVSKTIKKSNEEINKSNVHEIESVANAYIVDYVSDDTIIEKNILPEIREYLTGNMPEEQENDGYGVYVNGDYDVAIAVVYDEKCYLKDYDSQDVKISVSSAENCSIDNFNKWVEYSSTPSDLEITDDISSITQSDIKKTDTISIGSAEELAWLAFTVNNGISYEGKIIELTNDIDLGAIFDSDGNLIEGLSFTPIGYGKTDDKINAFSGTFNGNNHTIKGLYYNANDVSEDEKQTYVGLFGIINNATIKNLTLSDSYINNGSKGCVGIVGGISGNVENRGNVKLENIKSIGNILIGNKNVGGIIGQMATTSGISYVDNCYNSSNIKATEKISGGIIGSAYSYYDSKIIIKNNKNEGITNSLTWSSGIVAYVAYKTNGSVDIENNINVGNVICEKYGGGIVGAAWSDSSKDTQNDKYKYDSKFVIKSNENKGAIKCADSACAGIIASITCWSKNQNALIDSNVNNGIVSGEVKWIGGIVGVNNSTLTPVIVSNNINNAKITSGHGAFRVAGIVGNANSGIILYNDINNGEIDGIGDGTYKYQYGVGGIVGTIGHDAGDNTLKGISYISSCINNGNIYSKSLAGGIVGNLYIESKDEKVEYKDEYIINYSINNGNVESLNIAGGIIGSIGSNGFEERYADNIGQDLLNNGKVKGNYVGGLIGTNISLSNSITIGKLEGTNVDAVVSNIKNDQELNFNNVYYNNSYSSKYNYGTSIDVDTFDIKSVLGDKYFIYNNNKINLYKINLSFDSSTKKISTSPTNEILK